MGENVIGEELKPKQIKKTVENERLVKENLVEWGLSVNTTTKISFESS